MLTPSLYNTIESIRKLAIANGRTKTINRELHIQAIGLAPEPHTQTRGSDDHEEKATATLVQNLKPPSAKSQYAVPSTGSESASHPSKMTGKHRGAEAITASLGNQSSASASTPRTG